MEHLASPSRLVRLRNRPAVPRHAPVYGYYLPLTNDFHLLCFLLAGEFEPRI
jgi:hypothetical protein